MDDLKITAQMAGMFASVTLGMGLFFAALDADVAGYVAMRFVCASPVWTKRDYRPAQWECPSARCPNP